MIKIGLEKLLDQKPSWLKTSRIGLLSNQASTASDFLQSRLHLKKEFSDSLTCLFSPQHGFFAEKQDNMIESDHQTDDATGLKVYSLYGETRRPTEEMYSHLDVLLIDIVDVGTRVYTFMYTMAYCLELAAKMGKKIVVLDRPNPIGGTQIEGNLLLDDCTSFVGLYPIPMRHGFTFGELALFFNNEFGINADLEVIPMEGWKRDMYFRDTGFPWVYPSPNMPTPESAIVYPGQVIWEGTNISEGRGTTLPFELVGAPFWNCDEILHEIKQTPLPGCCFRPVAFEPTSGKFAQQTCNGFHLHVTDVGQFMPYRTSLVLLQAVMKLYPDDFRYKEPPYEYEYERLPMDLILGSKAIREKLENNVPIIDIEQEWQKELEKFDDTREKYFLYSN